MASRDDDKLVRQLSLIAFLMSQQRPVTADEIHEAVEGYGGMTEQAFLRRFYADRAEIESMGLRLAVERPGDDPFQGDLYALPPENYYLPELDFDEAELSALQTCLYLLEGQFAYAEPLRLALQHLTLGRPSPLDDRAARTVSVNLLGGDYSPEVAAHLTKIESAISRRKTIRFTYYTIGRDERAEREVDPYSLLYNAGNWYMIGHSHERDAMRIFRLSRIEGRITFKTRAEHDFRAPADFDLSRYRDRAPWQLEGPEQTATIALTPTIAWWVEGMFGAYGTTAMEPDGSAVYTTRYSSRRELLAWILGLGADARVLDPPELREAAIAALELAAERHQGGGGRPAPPAAPAAGGAPPAPASEAAPPAGGASAAAAERVVPAERFARLLALMTRLLAACGESAEAQIPVAELRQALNLDKRVLEDDIGLLNLINFGGGCYALFAQIDGDTVVVQKETYGDRFARPARLSPLEAKALLWALDFIGDRLPIEAGSSLSSVRAKLEAALGGDSLPTVELGQAQVADTGVAAAVSHAIREDRLLEIEYWTESRGAITRRTIEPHLLVNAQDAWYVVAYCRRAEGQRTFRLDRVRSASVLEERFARRPDIGSAGPYMPWGARPPLGGETVAQSASVWCAPSLARWMLEKHGSRERFADGSVLVEIPYASEEWLVRELLKYQGEAVLFEPVGLRRTVADLAEDVLARYRDGADHPSGGQRRRAPTR
ncbi:helix-turn-helix transcriptional regulator [Miltoncostaea marina]|uniref:helix-turn-helix transcriptional regulator n=1 Tax=Miltoncostaea marina TaxID=2843215 RepID=UPI001C3D19BC|nr:WYL domain-containing protein [Miltoncostaea marina]